MPVLYSREGIHGVVKKKKRKKAVNLDEVVIGRLSDKLLSMVDRMEINIADPEPFKPVAHLMLKEGDMLLELKMKIPIRKLILAIIGVGSGIMVTKDFLFKHFSKILFFQN